MYWTSMFTQEVRGKTYIPKRIMYPRGSLRFLICRATPRKTYPSIWNHPSEPFQLYIYNNIPVVPHKAVAEVSRIGHYRRD